MVCFVFETKSHIIRVGLELQVYLCLSPKCCDIRYALSCQAPKLAWNLGQDAWQVVIRLPGTRNHRKRLRTVCVPETVLGTLVQDKAWLQWQSFRLQNTWKVEMFGFFIHQTDLSQAPTVGQAHSQPREMPRHV